MLSIQWNAVSMNNLVISKFRTLNYLWLKTYCKFTEYHVYTLFAKLLALELITYYLCMNSLTLRIRTLCDGIIAPGETREVLSRAVQVRIIQSVPYHTRLSPSFNAKIKP